MYYLLWLLRVLLVTRQHQGEVHKKSHWKDTDVVSITTLIYRL
jgi:hypothetical protein